MYLYPALVAFGISLMGILLSLKYFPKWGIVDRQEKHSTHTRIGVRGGGLAISIAFLVTMFFFFEDFYHITGVIVASILIVFVNFVDDAKNISRYFRLFIEIIAAGIIILSGVGMESITSPFGGFYDLTVGSFMLGGFEISPIADIIALVWMVGLMNAINWLDGVDGLAGGITSIAAFILFILSLSPIVGQPEMALMAIILFASILGFLPFNFYDGRIKLGDTGAKFIGFILAITAILNQGKIATFVLVLGLPILDAVWVVLRRVFIDRKSPFHGDKGHFHHRLQRAGFSKRMTVIIIALFSVAFGMLSLILNNAQEKLIGLIGMSMLFILFSLWVSNKEKINKSFTKEI